MENNESINDMIRNKLELISTLKKCQSFMNMQRMMIIRGYKIKNEKVLEKYYLKADLTNKQSNDVINNQIKNIFNLNNYEQNIKSEAWHKDLNKMYLGLNDENKGKNDNAFFEYNYTNRNKKKEGLIFIRNFFGKMKNAKKIKNLYNKKNNNNNLYNINNIENKFFRIFKKNKKNSKNNNNKKEEKSEEEVNKIWNTIQSKYNNNSNNNSLIKENNEINNDIKYLTEMYNNNINNKYSIDNIKKRKLFRNKKIKKGFFPEITTSNSEKILFNKNKTYNEQIKQIYIGKNKYQYMTLNKENKNKNFDMPKLLEHKNYPLFKKNNQIFLSPLHYSKYEQMNEIRNKLIKVGFLDKDVFKIYNKNV